MVTSRDHTSYLVVEVKLLPSASPSDEVQLKAHMAGARIPTGLLVDMTFVAIFRDMFRDYSPASIERVGSIATSKFPDLQSFLLSGSRSEAGFEDAVQRWLIQLRNRYVHGYAQGFDSDPLILEHVIPALLSGEIRAGGPRMSVGAAR